MAIGLGVLLSALTLVTVWLAFSALTHSPAGAGEPSAVAAVTATAGATVTAGPSASAEASASVDQSGAPSGSVDPDATAAPTATPSPSPTPEPTGSVYNASVTFHDLALDAAADPGATTRTITFTSDGPGIVTAQVGAASPAADVKFCLQANEATPTCSTGTAPGFFTVAPMGDHAKWTVTLMATESGTNPAVDVTLTWRTRGPSITLSHGRFQGSTSPEALRGLRATFKTWAAGSINVAASWPSVTTDAVLTLRDVSSSPGSDVDQSRYTATAGLASAYTHSAEAGRTYEITLHNTGSDAGRPDLTATIAFP